MIDIVLISTAFAILLIGTLTDFKTREVPDWVNYSGIAAGLGIRLLYSAYTFDLSYIIAGILGFAVFFGLALAMFYMGQWGGGDSKMLMGLGALIGLHYIPRPGDLFVAFLVNALLIGAAYGILWSFYLAVRDRKKFIPLMNKRIKTKSYKKTKKFLFMSIALLAIASFLFDSYIAITLLMIAFVMLLMFYAFIFLTAVEKISFFKKIPVEKLTEGDWIVKDVVVGRKRICGPKDLGISKAQIKTLLRLKKKGKIRKVLIKEGMPFVPVFLIAFVVSVVVGNIVLMFV